MLTAGKWALAIVPGGILLGAVLGAAANPDMKDPPVPWWRMVGADQIFASEQYYAEVSPPEDLNVFGGYRPDLDYAAEVWALPIPEYELAALAEEPLEALPAELPTVTYGVTADEAADEAEAAAEDAVAAEGLEAAPAPAEARKSELALAGLY